MKHNYGESDSAKYIMIAGIDRNRGYRAEVSAIMNS